jgi:hypothetical protein
MSFKLKLSIAQAAGLRSCNGAAYFFAAIGLCNCSNSASAEKNRILLALLNNVPMLFVTVVQKLNQGTMNERAVYPCLAADKVRS